MYGRSATGVRYAPVKCRPGYGISVRLFREKPDGPRRNVRKRARRRRANSGRQTRRTSSVIRMIFIRPGGGLANGWAREGMARVGRATGPFEKLKAINKIVIYVRR